MTLLRLRPNIAPNNCVHASARLKMNCGWRNIPTWANSAASRSPASRMHGPIPKRLGHHASIPRNSRWIRDRKCHHLPVSAGIQPVEVAAVDDLCLPAVATKAETGTQPSRRKRRPWFPRLFPQASAPIAFAATIVIGATFRHEILVDGAHLMDFRLPGVVLVAINSGQSQDPDQRHAAEEDRRARRERWLAVA